jgi:hypothetical protein
VSERRPSAAEYLDRLLSDGLTPDLADPAWRGILARTARRVRTYVAPLASSFRPAEAAVVVDVLHPLLEAVERELATCTVRGEEVLAFETFVHADGWSGLRINEEVLGSEARLQLHRGGEASLAALDLWPEGLADVQAVTWPDAVRMAMLWLGGTLFAWTARRAYAEAIADAPEVCRWLVFSGARAKARRAAYARLDHSERDQALAVAGVRSILEGEEGSCLEGLVVHGGVPTGPRPHLEAIASSTTHRRRRIGKRRRPTRLAPGARRGTRSGAVWWIGRGSPEAARPPGGLRGPVDAEAALGIGMGRPRAAALRRDPGAPAARSFLSSRLPGKLRSACGGRPSINAG